VTLPLLVATEWRAYEPDVVAFSLRFGCHGIGSTTWLPGWYIRKPRLPVSLELIRGTWPDLSGAC